MTTISSTSSYVSASQGMGGMHRHHRDPSQLVDDLFAQLDTKNQGYLDKTDLQNALGTSSSTSSTAGSSNAASVDEIFSSLDGNNDGKITKEEMATGLKKLAEQLDSQRGSDRMAEAMGSMAQGMMGMPPPPPPQNDTGFTKDELTSQLSDATSSGDTRRADLLSSVVANFDKADANGDGKVTFQEAMAYKQSQGDTTSASNSGTDTASAASAAGTTTASDNVAARVLRQMMQLLAAYRPAETAATASLSTSA